MRSGYVYPGDSLRNAGSNGGFYWSGRAYSSSRAYTLYFISSSVRPSGSDLRYLGLSVRCVAGWE